ncbi:MAG TPA: malto-oligosyltrehalose synthase [Casimicrobiaceae bacterium]
MVRPDVPRATYRLQLNRGFTFAQATELVPYLAELGVSHVYLSPYFKARPGSLHGYDVVDHNALNPEIGSRAELDRLCATLREHGMEQVLDIVPNHVGVLGAVNPWWQDVLQNGRAAAYASFFDIDWERLRDGLHGKLLVPVLGEPYGVVLERGELVLAFDAAQGELGIRYGSHRFPLDPQTYPRILAPAAERLRPRLAEEEAALADAFDSLALAFGVLPKVIETAPARIAERQRNAPLYTQRLARLCARSAEVVRCIEEEVRQLNGRPGDPASFDNLDKLLSAQVFRLASWRMAADDINYRRFFDINELAALRVEEPAVFEATHRLLFELMASGQVSGVRVDHPDGLYDPAEYFARLQRGAAERLPAGTAIGDAAPPERALPLYILVEKIVAAFEQLPTAWPVAGTTGYDFANLVNGLFVDAGAEAKLTRGYFAFIRERPEFDEIVYRSKKRIMHITLAAELNALASLLARIAQANRATCDFTHYSLRAALTEVVACFPVYRTYVTSTQVSGEDRRFIDWAVRVARKKAAASEATVFDFIDAVLSTDLAQERPEAERAHIVRLAMKFQQFTGPVMAKGVEDTAFYLYNPLLSLNEVGGDPRRFGVSIAAFHHANAYRATHWPHAMLATSTHDSKRSEDVRARINVLSEMPAEWRLHVARWRRLNRSRKRKLEELEAPTRNDEYLLYQTLVGAWPANADEPAVCAELGERIERYLIKVVREAKAVSSWINPNEAYESAYVDFARALLTPPGNERFLADFIPFQRRVAWFGMLNSLAQTLLKLTAPGVPDIYQGCDLWQLSLVDPDNRRSVDYAPRVQALDAMRTAATGTEEALRSLAGDLLQHIDDGRIKQFVIWRALALRREREGLFRDGGYTPLPAAGAKADHVCAYARVLGEDCAIVIAPRLACTLMGGESRLPLGADVWEDTSVDVSGLPQPCLRNALTGVRVDATVVQSGVLSVAATLDIYPLALLVPDDR